MQQVQVSHTCQDLTNIIIDLLESYEVPLDQMYTTTSYNASNTVHFEQNK